MENWIGALGVFTFAFLYEVYKIWKKRWEEDGKESRMFSKLDKKSKHLARMHDLMSEIRAVARASSCRFFSYSNSVEGPEGIKYEYVELIDEAVANGVAPIIHTFKKEPLGIYSSILLEIDKADFYHVYDEELEKDSGTVQVNQLFGVRKAYSFKTGKRVWSGVVNISFHSDVEDLSVERVTEIQRMVYEVSQIRGKLKEIK